MSGTFSTFWMWSDKSTCVFYCDWIYRRMLLHILIIAPSASHAATSLVATSYTVSCLAALCWPCTGY